MIMMKINNQKITVTKTTMKTSKQSVWTALFKR